MKKVIVASQNPTKVKAVTIGFGQMFPNEDFSFEGVLVDSEVSHQPANDEETYLGAMNRAKNAQKSFPQAEFWVGLEGGIDTIFGEMSAFAWIIILSDGQKGAARTATFALPKAIIDLIQQGDELGVADDKVFGRADSKSKNGAVGILTGDAIDRSHYYAHSVALALIPFKNVKLYLDI